jgi:hypothetical protein
MPQITRNRLLADLNAIRYPSSCEHRWSSEDCKRCPLAAAMTIVAGGDSSVLGDRRPTTTLPEWPLRFPGGKTGRKSAPRHTGAANRVTGVTPGTLVTIN